MVRRQALGAWHPARVHARDALSLVNPACLFAKPSLPLAARLVSCMLDEPVVEWFAHEDGTRETVELEVSDH